MKARGERIVVVGSGVSGMSAAMSAVESGAVVTLVSRVVPVRSGSACIREGINADFEGDFDSHVADTLESGCGLADRRLVEKMCADAPRVADLVGGMGVVFDRTLGEGRVRVGLTCGSSSARAIYSGRATGAKVLGALGGQMLRHESHGRINAHYGWEFLSLIIDEGGKCRGVVAQDMRNMDMRAFPADAVIICSGGFQSLFAVHCSSELNDGFAAMRACEQGAIFANPEFVELFPFTVEAAGKCRSVVDAALVEGGDLYLERDGRPWHFLREFYPKEEGLVTRSRAMRAVFKARGEVGEGGAAVTLDLSHIEPAIMETKLSPVIDIFDGICEPGSCKAEVVPSVGLTLGGLWIDENHATSIGGLFAAGSSSCAYHGASSLAGNELLASVHGGMVAGRSAVEYAGSLSKGAEDLPSSLMEKAVDGEADVVARISAFDGRENVHEIGAELGGVMFDNIVAGKDNERLARAAGKVTELGDRVRRAPLMDRVEWANGELFFTRRLIGQLELARMVIDASIAREESRGCHYKPAHPDQDDAKWRAVTKASWKDGKVELDHSEKIK